MRRVIRPFKGKEAVADVERKIAPKNVWSRTTAALLDKKKQLRHRNSTNMIQSCFNQDPETWKIGSIQIEQRDIERWETTVKLRIRRQQRKDFLHRIETGYQNESTAIIRNETTFLLTQDKLPFSSQSVMCMGTRQYSVSSVTRNE